MSQNFLNINIGRHSPILDSHDDLQRFPFSINYRHICLAYLDLHSITSVYFLPAGKTRLVNFFFLYQRHFVIFIADSFYDNAFYFKTPRFFQCLTIFPMDWTRLCSIIDAHLFLSPQYWPKWTFTFCPKQCIYKLRHTKRKSYEQNWQMQEEIGKFAYNWETNGTHQNSFCCSFYKMQQYSLNRILILGYIMLYFHVWKLFSKGLHKQL